MSVPIILSSCVPHPGTQTRFHTSVPLSSCKRLVVSGSPRIEIRGRLYDYPGSAVFFFRPDWFHKRRRVSAACVRVVSSVDCELQSFSDRKDEKEVEVYVERIREAIGVDEVWGEKKEVTVSGKQTLLAMQGNWTLKWRHSDGCFWEQFDGVEISLEWGYNGEKSEPWAVDAAGRCSILELDDREVCLLASWIRQGFWLTREGQKRLHTCLVPDGIAGVDSLAPSEEVMLSVQLKDGKVVAYVVVDVTTMHPVRAAIRAFGGWSKWQYSDWKPLIAGRRHLFPFSSVHTHCSGNKEVYVVGECWEIKELLPFLCSSPILPLVSRPQKNHPRASIDSTCSADVHMLRAESGHYLVQPLINGKTIGYFIVDTGASSLVIAPEKFEHLRVNEAAQRFRDYTVPNTVTVGYDGIQPWNVGNTRIWQKARELGLSTFGEVHITGVNGVVKSQYCRATTFQLGQLRITNPVFMEVPVSGLVGGDPFVVGMCGFDVFAHCIVEMAYDEGRLSLFDPATYRLLHSESPQWHTLRLLESVPHILATFDGHKSALFLLDTGAGGVDVIFHGRAVKELNVSNSFNAEMTAELMGINASGQVVEVTLGKLDELTVGGRSFKQVKAMLARENAGNLDTSEYVAGLLCGDLLTKCRVVLDYAQRRFAIT